MIDALQRKKNPNEAMKAIIKNKFRRTGGGWTSLFLVCRMTRSWWGHVQAWACPCV